ncbi:hypothetical protein QZH41_010021 [Actinostola sp. cb2023]|nr:hypothetical protein QZH41_010021 [Actinostola sp. cb2023]
MKTKCLDFPCKYKGICIPFYNNDTYSCNCTQVFNGKNCENRCGPLGMEDGFISDDSITASSYYDNRFVPWHGRLNTHLGGNGGGWASKVKEATGEYLQIDLRSTYNISKVATQGKSGKSSSLKQWMTEYSLQYSDDGEKWTDYGVSGTQADLSVGCGPLGMEDGFISDDSITASSYHDYTLVPWHGRLNTHLVGNGGGWASINKATGEYLQIDLRSTYNISKVATQGRSGKISSVHQWMTEYSLQYSDEGEKWTDYGVSGSTQVFPGNSDKDTIVSHVLPVPIIARYLRFVVRKWNNWATMRVELSFNFAQSNGQCELLDTDMFQWPRSLRNSKNFNHFAIKADLSVGCGPLGMEDGFISDDSITASSYHDNTLVPWHGRLNTHLGENGGGWAPIVIEATGEYLQIDLRSTYNISKVATQGRSGKISPWNQWMTEYSLQYSDDGEKWTDYGVSGSTQVFPGNSDEDTIVSHVLPVPIIARYVRFVVRKWNNWATMRVELYNDCKSF